MFMLWFCALVLGAFTYTCHYEAKHPEVCVLEEQIVSVGGCNKYAECAVRTESGRKIIVKWPVASEMTCVEKVRR